MVNISVMVSGNGTNLQALIDGIKEGRIKGGKIGLVISSKKGAFALERAEKAGIKTVVIGKEEYETGDQIGTAILTALKKAKTDLVITAGYMSIIHKKVCREYADRMINIHPALLPKYGGKGFYGLNVHRAVLAAGEKESGATVHYVDDVGIDSGEIILQGRVPVLSGDTPETLQKRVQEESEHHIIVEATALLVRIIATEKDL